MARRIAHEIKNPLTPIQLSAERLKRRFAKEITSDPDTFVQCVDTIVRHVGDIGRMVDEFSAFARMPVPVVRPEDVGRIARDCAGSAAAGAVAHHVDDRHSRARALGALRPAADWPGADQPAAECGRLGVGRPGGGHIAVAVRTQAGVAKIEVTDDGAGLPKEDRERLTGTLRDA